MTSPLWEVTPGTPGVRREFLDYVADIANILAHQNARSVNDPRARMRRAAGACSENEVASTPFDVPIALPSVCVLAARTRPSTRSRSGRPRPLQHAPLAVAPAPRRRLDGRL